MDTTQKIEEGLQQLSDDKFYKPLGTPLVLDTALKVSRIVHILFRSGNIDTMTQKWLTIGLTLEENNFKFNERHFIQTHGVAMELRQQLLSLLFLWQIWKNDC